MSSTSTKPFKKQPYTPLYGPKASDEIKKQLSTTSTLYVGNLSFYTTEEQIYELFTKCGSIKRIIMGLNKKTKTPCGFCFVEYYTHEEAQCCVRYINGTRLDDRTIRTELDAGFVEGRQYGRGISGGQVRDEYRTDYDPGRGGYGKMRVRELVAEQPVLATSVLSVGLPPPPPMLLQPPPPPPTFPKRAREDDEDTEGVSKKIKAEEKNPRFRDD